MKRSLITTALAALATCAVAQNQNVAYQDQNVRFTVITDGAIRMEYTPDGQFLDNKSFIAVDRSYPAALMANEMSLCIGNKKLRADSVLYNRHLQPRMIMEYKAPTVEITQKVFEQIAAYNLLLHVDYLVVSNGLQHYCCRIDYDKRTYNFLQDIPTYESIADD